MRKFQGAFGSKGQEGGKDHVHIRALDAEYRRTEGEEKRRGLLASVMYLVLLYGAFVWELAVRKDEFKLNKFKEPGINTLLCL